MVQVPYIISLLAPDRRADHTCGKGLAKGMLVSITVSDIRVVAILFALAALLVGAAAFARGGEAALRW